MSEERWEKLTYWPLIIASVLFIVAYSWQVISVPTGMAETVTRFVMFATWAFFAVDYVVRLTIARERRRWFFRHLFDLAVVLIPAMRPLRLLKALTVIAALQRTAGAALRSRIAIYGAGAALTLIWMAALAVLEAERPAPDSNIHTFSDAFWWAFVTITTVGYGDFYPVTSWGRTVAVLLMTGGIAVVSIVTATVSSWVLEKAVGDDDDQEPATRGQVRQVARQITDVAARLGEAPPERRDGPSLGS